MKRICMHKVVLMVIGVYSFMITGHHVDTFYGPMEIHNETIIALLDHPFVQRLKHIHQYGVDHYFKKHDAYNRFDHSVGVLYLLHRFSASPHEQIAGLLHDVSHTVFSHVGDWIFDYKDGENSYQDDNHEYFLKKCGLETFLNNYQVSISDIHHKNKQFKRLEQPLPDMCADRIEYNLQGAFYEGLLTKEEIAEILDHLCFSDGVWYFNDAVVAKKFASLSLYMTVNVWGDPFRQICNKYVGKTLRRALDINYLTIEDILFGVDDDIWDKIWLRGNLHDEVICDCIQMSNHCNDLFVVQSDHQQPYDFLVEPKFRGIDPFVMTVDGLQRLTIIDNDFGQKYFAIKERFNKGFAIQRIVQK